MAYGLNLQQQQQYQSSTATSHYLPKPQYPRCDSYFSEDDDAIMARAAAERERRKAFNKNRQKQLAQELSDLTAEEYEDDILRHMLDMEDETLPDVNSIDVQTEIQWFMRPYLLDFLLEAHHAFQLLPETLYLTINLLDRYCSRRVVYKRHYQLVGCAALLIASKYGDRKERVPTIRELKSMCCSLYDEDMFTQMEWHVLQTLNWMVGHPTVSSFIDLALCESTPDPALENMALYISEIAMYHKEMVSVKPSVMASSSLALARCVLEKPQSRTEHFDSQVVSDLSTHLYQPSQALFRKYSYPHLSSVSLTVDEFLQRQARIARQPPQIDCTALPAVVTQLPPMELYSIPQTPQKTCYAMATSGVLTPPITPDSAYLSSGTFDPGQGQTTCTQIKGQCDFTPPTSAVQYQPCQPAQFSYPAYVL